jgi:hypothetical protein
MKLLLKQKKLLRLLEFKNYLILSTIMIPLFVSEIFKQRKNG